MFNNHFTSRTGYGGLGEDQNHLPALEGQQYDDDLYIQSDNEVTPMTDIEDSSGDEVYHDDYPRMCMNATHDVVKNSPDINQFSTTRTTSTTSTTQQTKHVMPAVKESPSVVTGRESNRRNKEELDNLKRNLIRTWCSSPHCNSVSSWSDGDENGWDDDGVDVDEDGIVSDAGGSKLVDNNGCGVVERGDVSIEAEYCVDVHRNHTFPTQVNDSHGEHNESDNVKQNMCPTIASESDEPDFKPLKKGPLSIYPSGTDPKPDSQSKATTKSMSQKQSSPTEIKQKKTREVSGNGKSQEPTSLSQDRKKKGIRQASPSKECPVCKKRFSSSGLQIHMNRSHIHTCDICGRVIKDLVLFQGHMREHAGEATPYWCDLCDKRFDSSAQVDRHRKRHTLKGHWECSKCGKAFNRRDNYLNHSRIHEDANMNKCDVCGRQYSSGAYLRKHMVVHLEEKPIECPVCEKRFYFKSTLVYHMRSHTAATVKSAVCEICGLLCNNNASLAAHMNIHSGTKPYVCKYCGKQFAQLSTKNGHEMTHNNPTKKFLDKESEEQRAMNMLRSFDCDQCLMSFTSWELLTLHTLKTHTTIPKETPSLDSDKAKNAKTSRQKSVKYPTTSKRSSDSEKDQPTSKRRFDPRKNVLTVKQRANSNKDLLTSLQRSTPAKDLPTSKQRFHQKLDLAKSKQRSSGGKAEHNTDKKKCTVCGKHVRDFGRHMKIHSERECVCRVCGKRFHLACNLKRHMRLHTGEMPFKCKISGKRFMKLEALKKHKARLKGSELEKKFECPTCGKKFIDNYHVRRHSVVHTKQQKIYDPNLLNKVT